MYYALRKQNVSTRKKYPIIIILCLAELCYNFFSTKPTINSPDNVIKNVFFSTLINLYTFIYTDTSGGVTSKTCLLLRLCLNKRIYLSWQIIPQTEIKLLRQCKGWLQILTLSLNTDSCDLSRGQEKPASSFR